MNISIIVAFEKSRGIGKDGRIVWDFPCDRLHFKELTMGNVVIFGRRTFEEIGRALPGRINIVVSGTKSFESENLFTCPSLSEAIKLAGRLAPARKIFLCGGQRIYSEGLALAQTIYTSQIDAAYPCDAFFPELPEGAFTVSDHTSTCENGIKLDFITFVRCQLTL